MTGRHRVGTFIDDICRAKDIRGGDAENTGVGFIARFLLDPCGSIMREDIAKDAMSPGKCYSSGIIGATRKRRRRVGRCAQVVNAFVTTRRNACSGSLWWNERA